MLLEAQALTFVILHLQSQVLLLVLGLVLDSCGLISMAILVLVTSQIGCKRSYHMCSRALSAGPSHRLPSLRDYRDT